MTVVDEIGVDKKLLSEAIGKNWIRTLSLPIVQREFVWESEDIRELVDSIIHDYPIGTFILWETEEEFPGSPLVDVDGHQESARTRTYIIDGQQRLTALLLIKDRWKIKREKFEITSEPIHYNPSNKSLYVSEKIGIDISLLVNAALGDVEAHQELMQKHPLEFKNAVTEIGTRIAGYALPIYTLKTKHKLSPEEQEDAAEEIAQIFTRVNRAGERLGNLQLFLSFFAAAFSELKKDLVDSYRSLNDKYNKEFPTWEVMNRFVFSNLDMTQTRITRVDSFTNAIREIKSDYAGKTNKLRNVITGSHDAADVIMGIVNGELGIYTPNRMPSQNALIPLFKWAYVKNITKVSQISNQTKNKMIGWFFVASFQSLYGNKINTRIQRDIETIEGKKDNKGFPLSELLENMRKEDVPTTIRKGDLTEFYYDIFRNDSYAMLLNVLLFRNGATNWAGQPVTSKPENAIHHIFPREYLKKNNIKDPVEVNDFANATMISSRINSEIGEQAPSDYLPTYDPQYLKSHMIPLNPKLWVADKYYDFLEAREKLIWDETKRMLAGLSSELV